jgi:hypothetical protein
MSCEETRRRLQESLDGTALPPKASRHVEGCDACRRYFEEIREVDGWLREEPPSAWRPTLTSGVMRRVRRDRVTGLWQVAAAAALLLLCVWLASEFLPDLPAVAEAERAVAEGLPVPESPEAVLRDVEGGFASLSAGLSDALGASDGTAGLPLVLLAVAGLLVLNGLFAAWGLLTRRSRS